MTTLSRFFRTNTGPKLLTWHALAATPHLANAQVWAKSKYSDKEEGMAVARSVIRIAYSAMRPLLAFRLSHDDMNVMTIISRVIMDTGNAHKMQNLDSHVALGRCCIILLQAYGDCTPIIHKGGVPLAMFALRSGLLAPDSPVLATFLPLIPAMRPKATQARLKRGGGRALENSSKRVCVTFNDTLVEYAPASTFACGYKRERASGDDPAPAYKRLCRDAGNKAHTHIVRDSMKGRKRMRAGPDRTVKRQRC